MQEHHEEHIDPDRIARLGRGPRGGAPRPPAGRASRPTGRDRERFPGPSRPQRVVVKVHISRHRSPQLGRQSLVRHVRYLGRDSALRDAPDVRFFDASREQLDAKSETKSWAPDRHHFRVIISPERGQEIADQTQYVRQVMARVEKDVGKLQWLAINHSNTDNPHAHVLIRGRAPDGKDLVLPRHYIAQGIRERASEVATQLLGERTPGEVKNALTKDVSAERWTPLDGAIERFAQPTDGRLHLAINKVKFSRYATLTPDLLAKRLEFLAKLGLAEQSPQRGIFPRQQAGWSVAPDFKHRLFELGARNDIIKNLYAALGKEAAALAPQVHRLQSDQVSDNAAPPMVRGIVAAKGTVNELTDEQFLAVRDAAGKLYYVRTWASDLTESVKAGSVVDVGRGAHRRWNEIREILRVAQTNQSLYSTGAHRTWLRGRQPKLPAEQVERRLRSFARHVHFMIRQPESGVTRAEPNSVRIDVPVLERIASQRHRSPDIRILAAYPLKEQVEAKAYTWLDRQIIRIRLAGELSPSDIVHAQTVRAAMERRGEWLVQNGYAKHDEHGMAQLIPGAAGKLLAEEQKSFAQDCKQKQGKSVSFLRDKDMLTGVYRGTVHLHAGVFAMIDTKQQLFAAPVSRDPRMEKGRLVTAKVVGLRHTQLEAATSRGPGRFLGMDR